MPVFTPAPGRAQDLRKALAELQGASRDDEGCLQYTVFDDGSRFVLIEGWRRQTDLDAHNEQAHTRDFVAVSPDLLAERFTVTPVTPLA
ncbi:antibiotic biosynthesis monooxygenase [Paenarthrobacter sp. DKR-5]|nr:antibiotic biosynthesis monooxygenase [Paenarthrobacter sp. DKR-5]